MHPSGILFLFRPIVEHHQLLQFLVFAANTCTFIERMMSGLFERLESIIGRDEGDSTFAELQRSMESGLEILKVGERGTMYEFPKFGLSIHCRDRVIIQVFLHLQSAGVKSGRVSPYKSDLPNGITGQDSRNSVFEKMRCPPNRSDRIQTKVALTFIFDGIEERLGAVAIHRLPNHGFVSSTQNSESL